MFNTKIKLSSVYLHSHLPNKVRALFSFHSSIPLKWGLYFTDYFYHKKKQARQVNKSERRPISILTQAICILPEPEGGKHLVHSRFYNGSQELNAHWGSRRREGCSSKPKDFNTSLTPKVGSFGVFLAGLPPVLIGQGPRPQWDDKKYFSRNPNFGVFSLVRDFNVLEKQSLTKFTSLCMISGSSRHTIGRANKITFNILCKLGRKYKNSQAVFLKALDNVKPILQVRKIRKSGSTQLVPGLISSKKQYNLAIRWIVDAAKKRRVIKKKSTVSDSLFDSLVEAYENTGSVRKKRDDLHQLAESNRAFAHYRWW